LVLKTPGASLSSAIPDGGSDLRDIPVFPVDRGASAAPNSTFIDFRELVGEEF